MQCCFAALAFFYTPQQINRQVLSTQRILQQFQAIGNPIKPSNNGSFSIKENKNLIQKNPQNVMTDLQYQKYLILSLSSRRSNFCVKNSNTFQQIENIRSNIIGFNTKFQSPFGYELQSIYANNSYLNRPYSSIETMIQYVKKYMANPHTQFSHFGKYTTNLMHYAHDSILESLNLDKHFFSALPVGYSSFQVLDKCIALLKSINCSNQPLVLINPSDSNQNIHLWMLSYKNLAKLSCDEDGNLIVKEIGKQILTSQSQTIILSISAISTKTANQNPLKQLNDTIKKLRRHKKIIFCLDCSNFCCHHYIDFRQCDQVDFLFLSPFKILGGIQSTGLLIARKSLIEFSKPTFPGGGTVRFVKGFSKDDVLYSVDIFEKQIAGTPNFAGYYRAALSLELLHIIGYNFIIDQQRQNIRYFLEIISEANNRLSTQKMMILIYGNKEAQKRKNLCLFNITNDNLEALDRKIVCSILSQVFGIEIACERYYNQALKQLNVKRQNKSQQCTFLRLDTPFYMQKYEIKFIADALQAIAKHWKNTGKIYFALNEKNNIKQSIFQKQRCQGKYNLESVQQVQKQLFKLLKTSNSRLSCRKDLLSNQFKIGLQLLENTE